MSAIWISGVSGVTWVEVGVKESQAHRKIVNKREQRMSKSGDEIVARQINERSSCRLSVCHTNSHWPERYRQ